jgi:hypothetical protein
MKRLAFIAFFALISSAEAQDITGQATVIDGDTIEIHGAVSQFPCKVRP